jgi:hypothetical protein
MGDISESITIAIFTSFGGTERLYCFFHLLKNLKKVRNKYNINNEQYENLKADTLHWHNITK